MFRNIFAMTVLSNLITNAVNSPRPRAETEIGRLSPEESETVLIVRGYDLLFAAPGRAGMR
jgi:hypothetical protein